jgi:hypothetical protein
MLDHTEGTNMCGSPIDKQAGDAGNAMSVNLMINYKVQGNPIKSAGVVNLFWPV